MIVSNFKYSDRVFVNTKVDPNSRQTDSKLERSPKGLKSTYDFFLHFERETYIVRRARAMSASN